MTLKQVISIQRGSVVLSNAAAKTMIDAALSLLALAACCDLLLQFARVRGWHPGSERVFTHEIGSQKCANSS